MTLIWDDIRVALTVARSGSTLAASHALNVSQTTVARRVDSLESALACRIFDRDPRGYRLTTAGLNALKAIGDIEQAVDRFTDHFPAIREQAAPQLTLATNGALARLIVLPMLDRLGLGFPKLNWTLIIKDTVSDRPGQPIDVEIGEGPAPADRGLITRTIVDPTGWDFYCSRQYACDRGVPRSLADLQDHRVLGSRELTRSLPSHGWMHEVATVTLSQNAHTLARLTAAVRAGEGLSILPRLMDRDPDLVRAPLAPQGAWGAEYWIAYSAANRSDPALRAIVSGCIDAIGNACAPAATIAVTNRSPP